MAVLLHIKEGRGLLAEHWFDHFSSSNLFWSSRNLCYIVYFFLFFFKIHLFA